MMARLILALLLFALGDVCFGQANSAASSLAPQSPAENTFAAPRPDEVDRLRDELKLVRENAVLQARSDLLQAAHSRLEILLTAFGIVLAFVAVVFGLSTREAAVASAKEGVEKIRQEMDQLRDQTRQAAEAHMDRLREVDTEASAIMDRLRTGEVPRDSHELRTVADAAKLAERKPAHERTIDDFRALITASLIAGDWEKMRDHAQALVYLFNDNDKAACEGLLNLGYALDHLGRFEEAFSVIRQLIDRFSDASDTELAIPTCIAMYNSGICLKALNRPEDAIRAYDAVNARFGDSSGSEFSEWVAKAHINKGVALTELGKLDEALATYAEVVRRFENSNDAELRKQVVLAFYNMGCTQALANDVEASIEALREWANRVGGFDCAKVAKDGDFDGIRETASFVAFLEQMGCSEKP